eukprot:TRINITY_DN113719_c0_g1_i1.p2 TRINITY_DN113719_c0_g1~~TRINITY_DN113719_c0_g1_i1.p2  ORF type:complete len:160 (+),score=39.59 TRINITY_DN113719_c0_g1_i1:44-523(+)
MGAAAEKCCASERNRGPNPQDLARRVHFDGDEDPMTSSEKVEVLRRFSKTDNRSSVSNAATASASRQRSSLVSASAKKEDAAGTVTSAPEAAAPEAAAPAAAKGDTEAAAAAKKKGARLLKAGLKSGEVSKIVDAKEAEEASKASKPAAAPQDEDLFEF